MRRVTLFILVPTILTLLVGCGADPSIRAGAWQCTTQYGNFTLYITDDGNAVKDVKYSVNCQSNGTDDRNYIKGEPWPLDGRKLNFGVYMAGQVPLVVWTGKFSNDGKTLKGKMSLFFGNCVTDFKITR